MNSKKTIVAVFIMLIILVGTLENAQGAESVKPLTIMWEKTEGIEKYQVQIMDSGGSVVLDKTVTTNYIEFILPAGLYKIRIAAINVFDKISFWSDWDTIEIRHAVKWEFFTNDYVEGVGLKISAGALYTMILPYWNSVYKNTYNYRCVIGLHFGNSRFIKPSGFWRYTGIELEGNYNNYSYSKRKNILFNSELMNITGGLNFFIKTDFKIPLNFYFVAGGGISRSVQNYTRYNTSIYPVPMQTGNKKSLDPYCKAGAGVEFNFLYAVSLDIGVDYFTIFYRDRFFNGLRYYALLGFRI